MRNTVSPMRAISGEYLKRLDAYAKEYGYEPSAHERQAIRTRLFDEMHKQHPKEIDAIRAYLNAFSRSTRGKSRGLKGFRKEDRAKMNAQEIEGRRLMNILNNYARERTRNLGHKEKPQVESPQIAAPPVTNGTPPPPPSDDEQRNPLLPLPVEAVTGGDRERRLYERMVETMLCAPNDAVAALLLGVHVSLPAKWRHAMRHRFQFSPLVVKGLPTATSTVWAATVVSVEDHRANIIKNIDKKLQGISLDDLVSIAELLEKR